MLTAQGRERKQQLLDGAAELFAANGYADTRVIDIVDHVGVAKGLFYWYFDNKETLFRELVELNRLRLRQAQAAAISPGAEALVAIRQGTEASMIHLSANARFHALLDVENLELSFSEVLAHGTRVHAADVAAHIRAGIDAGTIRDDDADALAFGVVGTVGSFSHFHRTGRLAMEMTELVPFVARWVVTSLATDTETARRALR